MVSTEIFFIYSAMNIDSYVALFKKQESAQHRNCQFPLFFIILYFLGLENYLFPRNYLLNLYQVSCINFQRPFVSFVLACSLFWSEFRSAVIAFTPLYFSRPYNMNSFIGGTPSFCGSRSCLLCVVTSHATQS